MTKDSPSLKTIRGAQLGASVDKSNVLIVNQPNTIHEWILNSGSCFHICSVREMFDEGSLHPMNETIYFADCKEYAITEVGIVTLEMHNGIFCTMMGGRYI
jgi:hypothetical protein